MPQLRVRARGLGERGADPRARAGARSRHHAPSARDRRRRPSCSGPGRLCQALGITDAQYGLALDHPPFEILARTQAVEVAVGARIGITKAVDHPWRYGLRGSRFLSKPFKR